MLEEKMEQTMLGDALLANIELNSLKLDDAITEVKQRNFGVRRRRRKNNSEAT
jgi:hypothetical protein